MRVHVSPIRRSATSGIVRGVSPEILELKVPYRQRERNCPAPCPTGLAVMEGRGLG